MAVGWRSALLALLPQRRSDVQHAAAPAPDVSRLSAEIDDDREPFHLDDTEIALRFVRSPMA
jgi:hypothetical protein